jgi:hypothetical protein
VPALATSDRAQVATERDQREDRGGDRGTDSGDGSGDGASSNSADGGGTTSGSAARTAAPPGRRGPAHRTVGHDRPGRVLG